MSLWSLDQLYFLALGPDGKPPAVRLGRLGPPWDRVVYLVEPGPGVEEFLVARVRDFSTNIKAIKIRPYHYSREEVKANVVDHNR